MFGIDEVFRVFLVIFVVGDRVFRVSRFSCGCFEWGCEEKRFVDYLWVSKYYGDLLFVFLGFFSEVRCFFFTERDFI